MFFAVAGHRLTVVATDARYAKPFAADYLMVASGQTVDALLRADRAAGDGGRYYMAARTFASNTNVDFNNSTATAILEYADARRGPPVFPATLPAVDDAAAAEAYTARLRSLASEAHPVDLPARADERLLVTMAVNLIPCVAPNAACTGPRGEPQQRELPEPRRRRHPRRLLPRRPRPRRVRRGLPPRPAVPLQLHRPGDPGGGAGRPVHGAGHQGEGAGARRRRGGGVPGHGGAGHGEPPHAPARGQLLRGGARARQLRRGKGPRRLEPGRPAAAEHGGRAQRRVGGDPLPRDKPRGVVHALPLRSARRVGNGHRVHRERRQGP
ncbi:putative laccase-9 [Panicum miliaceum]|uniref:Laccase-9 n=1 Tax=Panicum miliaceum TaxID=4540 RepID=A0A3L6S1T4_PANMI|nr:putative laccase-9 [Panicum miliaceum]